MMGSFQEAELELRINTLQMYFFSLNLLGSWQIWQHHRSYWCALSTLTFQQLACVSSIVSFWAPGNPRTLEPNPSKSIKKSMLFISKNSKDTSQSQRRHSLLPSQLRSAIISLEINFKCSLRWGCFWLYFSQVLWYFFFHASFKKKNKVGGWPVATDELIECLALGGSNGAKKCNWDNYCLTSS